MCTRNDLYLWVHVTKGMSVALSLLIFESSGPFHRKTLRITVPLLGESVVAVGFASQMTHRTGIQSIARTNCETNSRYIGETQWR